MIKVLLLVAIIIAGLVFGPDLAGNKGYILISMGEYTIETTVTKGLLLTLIFYIVLVGLEWLFHKVIGVSRNSLGWFSHRRHKKARQDTYAGMLALAEGHYDDAEKLTAKSAKHSDTPLLNYLTAAEAAHERGDTQKRDDYLKQANENQEHQFAVGLTQARLSLQQGLYEEAYADLKRLHQQQPKHHKVTRLLAEVMQQLQQWQELLVLFPALRKASEQTSETLDQLEVTAQAGALAQVASAEGSQGLQVYWNKLSRKLKAEPQLICQVATLLNQQQDSVAGASILVNSIKKDAQEDVLRCIGELNFEDPAPLLQGLKNLSRKEGNNALLWATYGKLLQQSGQTDEAISAFDKSLAINHTPAICFQLAELYQQQGQTNKANDLYKSGLSLAVS
ncbi:heme biosynthesis HemY N-terminal domain-containing protein [Motilimonas pumila]|uniref:Heme biosynthesis protein HemY n=1 Tax=Motilimonas pumila TaxID=2303987 RepID=A0A418YBV5_9GAMM|nr:heme biosynthesis HemY N-terminal domain-containing protein [Motilimonas pumila]RJG41946.1 heme biosynthesis protein HemY [Motilimonas pumila]